MKALDDFVKELHMLLSIFYEDEIMKEFIKPLVEDQSKMLEGKKA